MKTGRKKNQQETGKNVGETGWLAHHGNNLIYLILRAAASPEKARRRPHFTV